MLGDVQGIKDLVGVIPAAGMGTRMQPYPMSKELLPVGYWTPQVGPENRLVPKVVSQYVLDAMYGAGARNAFFIISTHKWEILKFFMSGARLGMHIGYLCQDEPLGMPGAIDLAYPWVRDRVVLMGMPDTILEPADCLAQLLEFHKQKAADLSLGVFPTQEPQSLAPVHLDRFGRVTEVFDKPAQPVDFNTWGVAIWTPVFTELLHHYVQCNGAKGPRELVLSDIFSEALHQRLRVYGRVFPNGKYYDVGTPEGLLQARFILEYHQTVALCTGYPWNGKPNSDEIEESREQPPPVQELQATTRSSGMANRVAAEPTVGGQAN